MEATTSYEINTPLPKVITKAKLTDPHCLLEKDINYYLLQGQKQSLKVITPTTTAMKNVTHTVLGYSNMIMSSIEVAASGINTTAINKKLLSTSFTPKGWDIVFINLEVNFDIIKNTLIQQYLRMSSQLNYYGYLPSKVTIRIRDKVSHNIAKPLENSQVYTPKARALPTFLGTNLGRNLTTLTACFGLDIIAARYKPFITEAPMVIPGAPVLSETAFKRVSYKEGEGDLILTTALKQSRKYAETRF